MEKKQDVPVLRFQGFSSDWGKYNLNMLSGLITKGTTPLDKSGKGNVNFVKIENIDANTGKIHITQKISQKEHNGYLKRSQLKENDILFSIAGTLGRVAVVNTNILPANTNQALAIIRLKKGHFKYIKTYLQGKAVANFLKANPTVGAQPNLSLAQVGSLEIIMPEKSEEQGNIADFFQCLDELIFRAVSKIQKLQQFRQAMLTKLFPREGAAEPELRFRGFSGPWAQGVLGNVAKRVIVGLATSVTPYYRETGIPIFRNLNIKKNYLDDQDILFLDKEYADCQKSKQIHTDDVLTVHTGYIGISCVVPPKYDGCLTFTTLITTPDTTVLNGKYLSQYLNTPFGMESMQAVTTQGGRNNLNVNDFVKVVIKYPDLDEQIKIAEFLTSLDTYISLQQKKLKRMQRLKAALLEKMFV